MGVVNTKATAITNADATPRTANSPYFERGLHLSSVGTVEVAAADSDGSVYRFARVPSGARLTSIVVFCDAITGGTGYDCGGYDVATVNAGALIVDNCYASALDLSSAITTGTQILFQAKDIINIEKRVWEDLALTVDPFKEIDICLTGDTVGTGAGTISLAVGWVV